MVSDLGVFDFGGPGHAMRLVSVHPGVTVGEVRAATGFELAAAEEVPYTREPTAEELRLIREVIDPKGCASAKCGADPMETAFTRLVGVEHPIAQTGMGWVAGPRLVSGAANAGALGILASATMTVDQLRSAVREVRSRVPDGTPFGVNLRADAGDAAERAQLIIDEGCGSPPSRSRPPRS